MCQRNWGHEFYPTFMVCIHMMSPEKCNNPTKKATHTHARAVVIDLHYTLCVKKHDKTLKTNCCLEKGREQIIVFEKERAIQLYRASHT